MATNTDSFLVLKNSGDSNTGDMVKSLFPDHTVNLAEDISSAMEFFTTSDVAVVVADIGTNNQDRTSIFERFRSRWFQNPRVLRPSA